MSVVDTFDSGELHSRWRPWTVGTGSLLHVDQSLRCVVAATPDKQYSDAQISDYQGLPRKKFPWKPPLRMTVRAWTSHPLAELKGTAGFGFWNEPFVPVGLTVPRLPRAIWFFFGSPPHNMALAKGVPGSGWKAATLDALRRPAMLMLPLAPLGFLLMRVPALYRRLWPIGQWAIGASEKILPVDLVEPHIYELDWLADRVVFRVDGMQVHSAPFSIKGPLGFIAWMDNQYAIVTPQGHLGHGILATNHEQWLALDQVVIGPL
jgi:hypothetical protein